MPYQCAKTTTKSLLLLARESQTSLTSTSPSLAIRPPVRWNLFHPTDSSPSTARTGPQRTHIRAPQVARKRFGQ
jgi:hypothetical protein